jgi:hypothetical protein
LFILLLAITALNQLMTDKKQRRNHRFCKRLKRFLCPQK